ncbi:MAG TPA: hypothetical protein VF397_03665 [Pyrinomonadaceae bacterium]
MGRIRIIFRQSVVETMLGILGQIVGKIAAESPQPWRPDGNQQSGNRLASFSQVYHTGFD